MDFCYNCGGKTDPDWVFCRSCGSTFDEDDTKVDAAPSGEAHGAPKVELISRGWDVVEAVELPADPLLDDDISPGPLPPDAIEVSIDDITVIEVEEETAAGEETAAEEQEAPEKPVDPWDHLRPHGELPPLQHHVGLSARIGQVLVMLTALSALAAAGIHFYLNTRLDAFSSGQVSARLVDDVEQIADISLLVVGGLIVVAALALLVWLIKARPTADFRPGKGGVVALMSFVAGVAVVVTSFFIKKDTVTEAIAANSLIVLGLGLLMTACLATVRTVERIDLKEPA